MTTFKMKPCRDCMNAPAPFQCKVPRDFSRMKAATVAWGVFTRLWWGPALTVTAPASGGYSQLPGVWWLLKQLSLCLQRPFGLKTCFHIITPVGLLLLSLDHFFPARIMCGQHKRCNTPCDPNKSQWHSYFNTSSHSQGPGQMSQDAVLYIYICLDNLKR